MLNAQRTSLYACALFAFLMAGECSPLGNNLEICPSFEQLKDFYRKQVRIFERKFIRKLKDGNNFSVTSESPREKVISLEVSKLVFEKSLASRFLFNEVLQRFPFTCEIRTLRRVCNIFGKDNLVRRFNSGDFTIIAPFYVVLENFVYEYECTSFEISKGQLVLAIEKGDNMKCLIPYGGSNPDEDDSTLPDGFSLRTIDVDGESLQYPQYKGSGTLKVEKGYDFVYSSCDVILPGDTLVIRNMIVHIISVVRDIFDRSSTKDFVRLDRPMNFNAKRCIFFIKRPMKIISQDVFVPLTKLKYVRKVSLTYHREDVILHQGEVQINFFNAAFNKCGIMTHDTAIPVEEYMP